MNPATLSIALPPATSSSKPAAHVAVPSHSCPRSAPQPTCDAVDAADSSTLESDEPLPLMPTRMATVEIKSVMEVLTASDFAIEEKPKLGHAEERELQLVQLGRRRRRAVGGRGHRATAAATRPMQPPAEQR